MGAEQFITSSVLVLAICLIRAVFAKRMSPTILYALWLLVAVKLLVPMTGLENRYNVMNLLAGQERVQTQTVTINSDTAQVNEGTAGAASAGAYAAADTGASAAAEETSAAKETSATEETPVKEETVGESAAAAEKSGSSAAESDSGAILRQILPDLAGWVARIGSGALAILFVVNNAIFYAKLRKARVPADEYQELTVYEIPGKSSPYLYGLRHPSIYLSRELRLPEDKENYILRHEYTHYRHLDHIWALVRSVCVILYWYHPLVWLAAVLSARDGELACDESVVRALNEERRIEYGETLLETLSHIRSTGLVKSPLGLSTGMTGGVREMKIRMERIAHQPRTGIAALVLAAAMGVALAGCTYGGATQEENEAQSAQEDALAVQAREIYGSVLDSLDEGMIYAVLQMDYTYPVLIVSDETWEEADEKQASVWGTVYYYVDGACKELGTVGTPGTVYPLEFARDGIIAGGGLLITKYAIDETAGTLAAEKIWEENHDNPDNYVYTVETAGTRETVTMDEYWDSYLQEYLMSQTIHFAYDDADCVNRINDISINAKANSELLRENPGEVGDYDMAGEDEVSLMLDFNNDGQSELIYLKKGNSERKKDENGGWDYYQLVAEGVTVDGYGDDVIGRLSAVSLDGENILIGIVNVGPESYDPVTTFYAYTEEDGKADFRKVGSVDADIRKGEDITSGITVEDGKVYVWEAYPHLYLDYILVSYEIGEDGTLSRITQDSYDLMEYPYRLSSVREGPELLADVTLYDSPEGEIIGTATAGQMVQFRQVAGKLAGRYASDTETESTWYYLWDAASGQELGWIESHWYAENLTTVWGGTGLGEREVFAGYTMWAG